jgi:hypothetical protein
MEPGALLRDRQQVPLLQTQATRSQAAGHGYMKDLGANEEALKGASSLFFFFLKKIKFRIIPKPLISDLFEQLF